LAAGCDRRPGVPGNLSTADASAAVPFAAVPPASQPSAIVREWFALGSGCRAKFDIPGDVTFEDRGEPSKGIHANRLRLSAFALAGRPDLPLQFVRDCGVRLGVFPPDDTLIRRVVARTRLFASKGPAGELELVEELKLGAQSLAIAKKTFP